MVAIVDKLMGHDSDGNAICYQEIFGTNNDTKPTGNLVSGSSFVEVDTGDVYMYNEDAAAGSEWVKEFSLQG